MNWERLTRTMPLENDRDVLARIGFRFLWVTAPFFAAIWLFGLGPFDPDGQPAGRVISLFAFAMPLLGGALDWLRVRR